MRFWSLSCCVIQLELSHVASKVLGILLWHEAHAIAGDLDGATAHFAAACQLNLPNLEGLRSKMYFDPQRNGCLEYVGILDS